jgi:hypothetical protein
VGYLAPQCKRCCHNPSISAVPSDRITPKPQKLGLPQISHR